MQRHPKAFKPSSTTFCAALPPSKTAQQHLQQQHMPVHLQRSMPRPKHHSRCTPCRSCCTNRAGYILLRSSEPGWPLERQQQQACVVLTANVCALAGGTAHGDGWAGNCSRPCGSCPDDSSRYRHGDGDRYAAHTGRHRADETGSEGQVRTHLGATSVCLPCSRIQYVCCIVLADALLPRLRVQLCVPLLPRGAWHLVLAGPAPAEVHGALVHAACCRAPAVHPSGVACIRARSSSGPQQPPLRLLCHLAGWTGLRRRQGRRCT
jgi:hypothetical protein